VNASNKLVARSIRGLGLIAQKDGKGILSYYLHNAHGDVTNIADANGNILNSYTYDAFGNTTSYAEKVSNRFMYAGEQFDSITGQYYLRARYYDPQVGRFTQEDPYRGDGLNLYAYVSNNPVNFTDPSGHDKGTGNSLGTKILGGIQLVLDVIGLIPGIGEIADGTNAGIYTLRGDYVNAGLSGAACIPFAGWFATGGKLVNKLVKAVGKIDDASDVVKVITKSADEIVEGTLSTASKYEDITSAGSRYINKSTNVTKAEFGENLTQNGWSKSIS